MGRIPNRHPSRDRMGARTHRPYPQTIHILTEKIHCFPAALGCILFHFFQYHLHSRSRKSMLSGRWTFVSRFWMVVAHDVVVVPLLGVLFLEHGVHSFEHRLRCHRTVRAGGLSSFIWITTPSLYAAKFLGVSTRQCSIFFLPFLTKSDSRVWHQMLRRLLTSNTNFIANALHLPRGIFMTYFKHFSFLGCSTPSQSTSPPN